MTKTNFRWVIIAFLFVISLVNYIDRASIAYAIDLIALDFHLTESEIGLILGSFGIGYAITTFLGGIAVDFYGAKRLLTIAAVFWAIASLLTGMATGFIMVFAARVLLGFAEGPNFPAVARAVSDWLPQKERNRAFSMALISVPLALALGGPIVSQLIWYFTWRGAYYALAVLTLIWAPLWWFLFKDKPADSAHVNSLELAYIGEAEVHSVHLMNDKNPWKVLLFNKTLLVNNWAFFVFGFYLFFFMTWLPNYLTHQYHMNLKQIGWYSMGPWLLAACLMAAVSALSDYIFKKTRNLRWSRTYPILFSQLLAALCVVPIAYIESSNVALLLIMLAVGFAMSANACFYTVNVDIAKKRAGTSLGIMDTVFAIAGFLSPVLTGIIVSTTGHFESVFLLMALLGLSSVILTACFHNRNEASLLG